MVHLRFPVFMNTLPEKYKIRYTVWKNHADYKYDSQFALRSIPDYEPLRTSLQWTTPVFSKFAGKSEQTCGPRPSSQWAAAGFKPMTSPTLAYLKVGTVTDWDTYWYSY